MSYQEIQSRFALSATSIEEEPDDLGAIRTMTGDLAMDFSAMLPDGREKALALTKLEEALFWANAAIARNNTEEG